MKLKWTTFTGEYPRLAAYLLPENAAQFANNCDFRDGSLSSLNGLSEAFPMQGPARGLFTDDGLRFFTWTEPTKAYLSQVIDDTFERIYFCNASQGLRVTQRLYLRTNGGPPSSSWKVGVPAPTVAPTITAVDRATWPHDSAAHLMFKFFFERGGQKIDESVFEPTTVTKWRKYQVGSDSLGVGGTGSGTGGTASFDLLITDYAYRIPVVVGEDSVFAEAEVHLTAPLEIVVTDSDSITLPASAWPVPNAGPRTQPAVTRVKSGGNWVAVDTLYYAKAAGNLSSVLGTNPLPATESAVDATVDTSLACVEVTLVGGDGKALWTAFSKNSAFASTVSSVPGGLEVVSSLIDGTLTIELLWGVADTRSYVATAVNDWGEESAPSPPVLIDLQYIQQADSSIGYAMAADYYPLKGISFYRTSQGSADYFAVSSAFTAPGAVLSDSSVPGEDAPATAIVLKSFTWGTPPDGARNLIALPNGIFAVSHGKDIWYSEPYRPHAFPYSMTLPHAVVGMCETDAGALVTTTAYPYWISGAHSSAMSNQKIQARQAGVSNDSMCQVGDGVVYATNDGLVFVRGLQASLEASNQFFTRKSWRARFGAVLRDMKLFAHDGYLCGLFESAEGFMIRLEEGGSYSGLGMLGYGAFVLPQTDIAYIGTVGGIAEFEGGPLLDLLWNSRDVLLPRPYNFGAAHFVGSGSITVTLIGDDQIVDVRQCLGETEYRPPAGRKARRWLVQFAGQGVVKEFHLAGSFTELKDV